MTPPRAIEGALVAFLCPEYLNIIRHENCSLQSGPRHQLSCRRSCLRLEVLQAVSGNHGYARLRKNADFLLF